MDNKDISFSASAAMIKRLGDELIKDFHTAFFELIKNCYDADATQVDVKFRNIKQDNGVIIIQDNGAGMSLDDLKQKWARVAGENKVRAPYTEKYNRRRLGAKGIGRFSAAKLGNKIKITTKREAEREQLVFKIDFRDFTDDKNLDEIKIHCKSGKTRQGSTNSTSRLLNIFPPSMWTNGSSQVKTICSFKSDLPMARPCFSSSWSVRAGSWHMRGKPRRLPLALGRKQRSSTPISMFLAELKQNKLSACHAWSRHQ